MKRIRKISFILCIATIISLFTITPVNSANEPEWATTVPALPDYDYSFAVLGDTQNLMKYDNYDNYVAMYDWIIDNKDTQKIKFVMGLGDITEDCTVKEFEYAKKVRTKLCENDILNSFIRGNHDKLESRFNLYFPYKEFGSTVTGSYKNDMLNTYTKFTAGNVKYIVFALTVGPDDNILNWVGNIASQNPDHNIIITTHVYLTDKGTHTKAPAANHKIYYGVNGGEQIWDKLVKKHENIVMVLSGHYAQRAIERTQLPGKNGKTVTELMIDAEQPDEDHRDIGGLGLVAMFYFSENGRRLDVRYYSTVHKKYFMNTNQFSLYLNVVGVPEVDNTPPETTASTSTETTSVPTTNAPTTDPSETNAPTANTSTTDIPVTNVPTTNSPATGKPKAPTDKTTEEMSVQPNDTSNSAPNNDQRQKDNYILIIIFLISIILVLGLIISFTVLKKKKQ